MGALVRLFRRTLLVDSTGVSFSPDRDRAARILASRVAGWRRPRRSVGETIS
jgi:hypothetical protein